MSLIEGLKERFMGRKYECQKCSEQFRGNRDSCPSCGHTVFMLAE